MSITTSAVVRPADFEKAKTSVQETDDSHIAAIHIDGLTIQASSDGDSARTLVEGFRLLADKVEAAHREWLRTKAAEQ